MDPRELIHKWIAWKSDRDHKQYSFRALASDAGLNPNYLSNVMTGIRNPGVKTLRKIADAFGISIAEFYVGPSEAGSRTPENSSVTEKTQVITPVSALVEPKQDIPASGKKMGKTDSSDVTYEKFGLKLSSNAYAQFNKLFSNFGFESDGDSPQLHLPFAEKTLPVIEEIMPESTETTVSDTKVSSVEHDSRSQTTVLKKKKTEKQSENHAPSDMADSDTIPLIDKEFRVDLREWIADYDKNKKECMSIQRFYGVKGSYIFAICVEDTSMTPDLNQGDILIIDPEIPFVNTIGGIGVIHDKNSFKIRRIYSQGSNYLLVPTNPLYEPEIIPKEETTILKVAQWLPRSEDKF